ncbi:MAG: carboxypeptidase regulatory-like domain-containing protein [Bryobacteraceae bacterium]|nr:carboxypeptidase regulatory-like domain-containing protein [Bryobacteraceae bacterium]
MTKPPLIAMAFLLGAGCLPSWGQATSSLQGTVTDPSGAVVPNATIEIQHVATQATLTTKSNDVGIYRFPQVQPGTYRIIANANGLAQVGIAEVALPVNQPVTINIGFTQVGSVSEVISVEAEGAQINTVDASLGNAVGTRPILQLPFEARNVVSLLSLQPGVAYIRDTGEMFADDTRNGAVNGGKSDQANITLDGVDVNEQQNNYAFSSVLRSTLDSVQEFRTTTLNAGAEEGRSSGAQVALVTKAGGNDFHGALYEYLRNTKTSANSYFNNAVPASDDNPSGGIERQKLNRNVFGAAIGGPIKKNRLFFFFNYEGHRYSSEESVVRTVPSANLREGIVQYLSTDGSVGTLTPADLQTRIDPAGIGVSQGVLDYFRSYPLPNDDTTGDGLNTRGYRFKSPVKTNLNTYITRWDWYADSASRHQFFFRGNYQDDSDQDVSQFPGTGRRYTFLTNTKGLAVGYNTTISPSLFSAFRYGYTRQGVEQAGGQSTPVVTFRGLDALYPDTPSLTRIVPVHTFREDMSWIKGRHQLKFGGVVRLIDNNRVNYNRSWHGAVVNASVLRGSGSELNAPVPDLDVAFRTSYRWAVANVLGLVSQVDSTYNYDASGAVQPQGAPVIREFAQEQYEFYFNDSWRLTRGLTLTAGVRWSLMPPVHETNGLQVSAIPSLGEWFNTRGQLAQEGRSQAEAGEIQYTLRDGAQGRPLYPYHKKNFAPRISLAYSPQADDGFWGKLFGGPGRTSFRAGFGMFYDNFGQGVIRFFDNYALGLSTNIPSPTSQPVASVSRFIAWNQIPSQAIQPAPPREFPQTAPPVNDVTGAVDDTIRPPYSMALNFSIGRELPRDFFVEASYVGRLSRRSLTQRDLAIPADIKDPASGQTYFGAAKQLIRLAEQDTPIENVAPIAYWENLFPDLAFDGLTATQNAYGLYADSMPDYTGALITLDALGFSRLGPWSYFNEQYLSLTAWSSIAGGNYHAGQLTLRKRFSGGLQFDLNYTLSKSLDLGSAAERTNIWTDMMINPWQPWQMKAVSDYDVRHLVNANWVAELPFGRGKKWGSGWNPVVNQILGGWQLSGLWRMSSGLPATVDNGGAWPTNWQIGGYATQDGPNPAQGVYKNAPAIAGNPGVNLFPDPGVAIESWRNTDVGESGQRNGVRGDGYFTLDMGLAKRFTMPWELHSLQFRWEVFNVANTARFDPWSASLSLGGRGSFGKYQDLLTNPRVMQFALRYEF